MARQGQPEELKRRGEQVLRYAEDPATLRRAHTLLGLPNPETLPHLSKEAISSATVVLLPIGDVSEFVLEELRDALAARVDTEVVIARVSVDLGPPSRNLRDMTCRELRRGFLDRWKQEPGFAEFLQGHGISHAALVSDDAAVFRTLKLVLQDEGSPALKHIDEQLQLLGQSGLQWEAQRALQSLSWQLKNYNKQRWAFIGVAAQDIYIEPHNFVFGAVSSPPIALVSAARFTALATSETPRRQRLVARLLKQTLSSYSQMFGLARCSVPDCVRSYPNSVAELDAKGDTFCSDCRGRMEFALGRKLPQDA